MMDKPVVCGTPPFAHVPSLSHTLPVGQMSASSDQASNLARLFEEAFQMVDEKYYSVERAGASTLIPPGPQRRRSDINTISTGFVRLFECDVLHRLDIAYECSMCHFSYSNM